MYRCRPLDSLHWKLDGGNAVVLSHGRGWCEGCEGKLCFCPTAWVCCVRSPGVTTFWTFRCKQITSVSFCSFFGPKVAILLEPTSNQQTATLNGERLDLCRCHDFPVWFHHRLYLCKGYCAIYFHPGDKCVENEDLLFAAAFMFRSVSSSMRVLLSTVAYQHFTASVLGCRRACLLQPPSQRHRSRSNLLLCGIQSESGPDGDLIGTIQTPMNTLMPLRKLSFFEGTLFGVHLKGVDRNTTHFGEPLSLRHPHWL